MAELALVDDHILLRAGLSSLVTNLGYNVLFEADNGNDLINKLSVGPMPQLILMDIHMPEKDGYETTVWLKKNYPEINVLALTMYDSENAIIRMIKSGAKGYILKDCNPSDLQFAIEEILIKGYYYSEQVSGKLMNAISTMDVATQMDVTKLNEREIFFLKLTCTELTYKDIAEKMCVSPRTVDGYRDTLFKKLKVKTRVGLVMYAVKSGVTDLSNDYH